MQGEDRRTYGELRLAGHRSSKNNLEERGGRGSDRARIWESGMECLRRSGAR